MSRLTQLGAQLDRLTSYAPLFLRLGVGGVFLKHGIGKVQMGVAPVAGFLQSLGVPLPSVFAVILIGVETIGAACLVLGILTRFWAACLAVNMVVAILASVLPKGGNMELEGLLLAGAFALVLLGGGALSVGPRLKSAG